MFAFETSGRNSTVECQLPKLKVASSILVARSNESIEIFFEVEATLQPTAVISACSTKLNERLKINWQRGLPCCRLKLIAKNSRGQK
jgi:hypothetical protein